MKLKTLDIPVENWCHEMCHCPFISYFTNIINTLLTLTPQMAASASFWTAKQDVARWLSLAKKHPSFIGHRHRHLSPSKTNTLQISHPPYKPARGFRGEGEARLWWELLLFSRARADCKGAGWALEQSCWVQIPLGAAWRGSRTSFPGGASTLDLGSLRPWARGRVPAVGRRPSATRRAGKRAPRSGGPRWTPETGLRGELAPSAAVSKPGDALEPAAGPAARRVPSAPASRAEPDVGLARSSASVEEEARPAARRSAGGSTRSPVVSTAAGSASHAGTSSLKAETESRLRQSSAYTSFYDLE